MARSVQLAVTIAVVAAVLLAAATTSEAAVTCGQVNSAIGPCLAYARGSGQQPLDGLLQRREEPQLRGPQHH